MTSSQLDVCWACGVDFSIVGGFLERKRRPWKTFSSSWIPLMGELW